MWTANSQDLQHGNALKLKLEHDSRPATYADVVQALQEDPGFRDFFNSLLADVPFAAFRWETPSLTTESQSQRFECVVLNSPGLARHPDSKAFDEHFKCNGPDVIAFPNLGGDAIMVVPLPIGSHEAYGHLASFVRLAPEAQRDSLWKLVGEAMSKRLSTKPVWLSTAGAGVAWLHVRLDDRPKYYGYGPYRQNC